MLGCPASDAELIEWSKELGSDITFFLSKGTAYCTGRGEILEPLPALAASNSIYIVKVCFVWSCLRKQSHTYTQRN